MTESRQIVRYLLENEESDDFSWKELVTEPRYKVNDYVVWRNKIWAVIEIHNPGEKAEYCAICDPFGNIMSPVAPRDLKPASPEQKEGFNRASDAYIGQLGEAYEENDDDGFDWKDITTDLPRLLEEAGFTRYGQFTWSYQINRWMKVQVRLELENGWSGMITFEGMVLNQFKGTDVEMARWLESTGNWPEKHFTDWNKWAAAAKGRGIREDEEDDDWKEVTPPVRAYGVQRWVFTEWELSHPQNCYAVDPFIVTVESGTAVLGRRNGQITSLWADGTSGVPQHVIDAANEIETYEKPVSWRVNHTEYTASGDHWGNPKDIIADTWLDVYLNQDGGFAGFVDPRRTTESEEEEEEGEDFDVGIPMPFDDLLKRSGFKPVQYTWGTHWEKVFNRGQSRLRIEQMGDSGSRQVSYISGNLAMWTKSYSDEELLELLDRVGCLRIK